MKKYKATIKVNLKPTIKDIKGKTLERAVSHLVEVKNLKCKTGNIYTLEFDAENSSDAKAIAETIAEEILANNVIEEYEIIWQE